MRLTRPQRLMVEDGFPAELFRTVEQRRAYWDAHPPVAIPLFKLQRDEDAETRAMRERLRQEEITALRSRLARSARRKAAKAIDFSKMRWDSRRNRFVPDVMPGTTKSAPVRSAYHNIGERLPKREPAVTGAGTRTIINKLATAPGCEDWSRVTKDTARALAELNGVWDDKYAKLSGGLLVMTVTNRLKGLVRRGEAVRWT